MQCQNIPVCEEEGGTPTCLCSQIAVDDEDYLDGAKGLKTRNDIAAKAVINFTNHTAIPLGSTIHSTWIDIIFWVGSGMDTCTIEYSFDQGSTWEGYLDTDCTDETTESTKSYTIPTTQEDEIENLSIRITAVESKSSPNYLYVDFMNVTINYTVPPIVILLNSPDDNSRVTLRNVSFRFTPTSSNNLINCSLWTNESGIFERVETNSTPLNNGEENEINHTLPYDGYFIWNIRCFDTENSSFASNNFTLLVDTLAPNITLISPGNDSIVTSPYGVTFSYNVSDKPNNTIENCSLIIDGSIKETEFVVIPETTQKFENVFVENGIHTWNINCTDSGNLVGESEKRIINISVEQVEWQKRWYETSTASYNYAALINLSNLRDDEENNRSFTVALEVLTHVINATSPYLGNNGVLIPSGTLVSFSAVVSATTSNRGYITWKLYILNSSGETLICQHGDDDTSGTRITSTSGTWTGSCTSPNYDLRLFNTDRLKLIMNIFNSPSSAVSVDYVHFWDALHLSYVELANFTVLGEIDVDLTSPLTDPNIIVGETFNIGCEVNCSIGNCLNTKVYIQYNTSSTDWVNIGNSGNIVLATGETNPHSLGTVTNITNITNFTVKGNTASVNNIRCIAVSDYSKKNGTTTTQVTVSTGVVPPQVNLTQPEDNYWSNLNNITLYYNVSDDNNNIANCSLILNSQLNQTNSTPILNGEINNFTLTNLAEGSYNWTVNCTDTTNLVGTDTERTFYIDTEKPIIILNNPENNETLYKSTIDFNFTVIDNLDTILLCNLTLDGVVVDEEFSVQNGTLTNRTLTGIGIGNHSWNVTCWDEAGNINTSETWNFSVIDLPPDVTLITTNLTWFNSSTIILEYNVTDNNDLQYCDLYLNSQLNQTNSTPILNGEINNFTLTNLAEGSYNWTVNCTDTGNLTDKAPTQIFYVDIQRPIINLNAPANESSSPSSTVNFNFTVTDNMDSVLTCNLTINNQVVDANFNATNSSLTNRQISNLEDGIKYWNVSCSDEAGNSNTSITWQIEVKEPPTVVLVTQNETWDNDGNIVLEYTPTDNTGFINCSLILNSQLNQTNSTPILNGEINNFTLTNLAEGSYNWTVNCTDTTNLVGTDTERTFYIDTEKPIIILNNPENNDIETWNNITFNFTVIDNLDTILLCNISVDDFPEFTGINASNGTNVLKYLVRSDGNYTWQVECVDDAGNYNQSPKYNFTVEAPPNITLEMPVNETRTYDENITFIYTPEDVIGITQCSLILDGTINKTDTDIETNQQNSFFVQGIEEGKHNWTVNCTDTDSNTKQPTPYVFYIDKTPPLIQLYNPTDGEIVDYNLNNITFNFTAIDNLDVNITCNLTIDSTVNKSNINVTNSSAVEIAIYGFDLGQHFWNVTCWDRANNTNTSETRSFVLGKPDLTIQSSDIVFNNSNPKENEIIIINATIHNIGDANSTNITVQFFEGDPYYEGIQIDSNKTISLLEAGKSVTLNVSWQAKIGPTNIFVIVDPPVENNGTIIELNESNNKANKTISVGAWHFVYGLITEESKFELTTDSSNATLIVWNATERNRTNIFVVDLDSIISWSDLQALGKNITGGNTTNDFEEIDMLLNMSNFSDSIYKLYTINGIPIKTYNFYIFGKYVNNVPVTNSTNNSNFLTGILWDMGDDSDNEYSVNDKEDIVFITQVNPGKQGAYGIYDYEIRIPARLREYIAQNINNVALYYELY